MKIALISPQFPPDRGGVSDYTFRLAKELHQLDHEVGIWSAQKNPLQLGSSYSHFEHRPWTPLSWRRISHSLQKWNPSAVLIQYTPYLYAPNFYGIEPTLPLWVAYLRTQLQAPVILMTHELHYPPGFKPDRLFIGVPQTAQFAGLVLAAQSVVFSYELPLIKYQRRLSWKKKNLEWIPVGANIEPTDTKSIDKKISSRVGNKKVLLHFGSDHPTRLLDLTLDAYRAVKSEMDTCLVFAGLDQKTIGVQDPGIIALGYVSSEEASAWMKRADLLLAPFYDGISTRRTSVMSALAHGCPVLTNRDYHTDPSVPWEQICELVNGTDPKAFAQSALKLLQSPERLRQLSQNGQNAFNERFSWPVIAKHWIQHIKLLSPSAGL